jgi:hypothetical protein
MVEDIRKGWNFGRRRQLKQKCSKSTRRRDFEEPLHPRKGRITSYSIGGQSREQQPRLESMRNSSKVFGKTVGLEFGKQEFEISSGIRRRRNWSLWRGRPPPKRKKKS